jgi:predicted porin
MAPMAPTTCMTFYDFLATACPLTWYGITVYGTIDVGVGYQTHGAPFDKYFVTGASYFIQKMNRSAMWGLAPNGLSQSNIGIKGKEQIAPGLDFIFQLEAGFDPYSLQFANSPQSLFENRGLPVNQQSTNGDSSRAGGWYNSVGFAGISSPTYGTLTFGRQNALTLDGIAAYDPMGLSYAFSPIGFSGVAGGVGLTEEARANTSAKYRFSYGDFRLGALYQFGGYDLGNGATGQYQGQIGGDIKHVGAGTLSLDGIVSYERNAIALGLSGGSAAGTIGNAAGIPTANTTVTATLANVTSYMALAKYVVGPFKIMAGYEYDNFAPPSDVPSSLQAVNGPWVGTGYPGTSISSTNYNGTVGNGTDKHLQIMWIGAKYAVTENLEVTGAYYHYIQGNYLVAGAGKSCTGTFGNEGNGDCAGTMDAFSGLIDWKFAPKWDTYFGIMYSQMNGGLANGYLVRNNLDPTVGLRFRF